MIKSIVHSTVPITLVGGGQATVREVQKALTIAPICVAVDGGLSLALAAGADPQAVIGDMDSVEYAALAQMPRERRHRITEQQSTDFDKALRCVDAPAVVAVGFCGGRLDHQLAALHVLLAHQDRACILMAGDQIALHAPPDISMPTQSGDVVSLFPMAQVTGRSTGLEWPIDGLEFDPATFIGTSNRATGRVQLWMDGPGMILMAPVGLIQPVVETLSVPQAAQWPARAEPRRSQPPS